MMKEYVLKTANEVRAQGRHLLEMAEFLEGFARLDDGAVTAGNSVSVEIAAKPPDDATRGKGNPRRSQSAAPGHRRPHENSFASAYLLAMEAMTGPFGVQELHDAAAKEIFGKPPRRKLAADWLHLALGKKLVKRIGRGQYERVDAPHTRTAAMADQIRAEVEAKQRSKESGE